MPGSRHDASVSESRFSRLRLSHLPSARGSTSSHSTSLPLLSESDMIAIVTTRSFAPVTTWTPFTVGGAPFRLLALLSPFEESMVLFHPPHKYPTPCSGQKHIKPFCYKLLSEWLLKVIQFMMQSPYKQLILRFCKSKLKPIRPSFSEE